MVRGATIGGWWQLLLGGEWLDTRRGRRRAVAARSLESSNLRSAGRQTGPRCAACTHARTGVTPIRLGLRPR